MGYRIRRCGDNQFKRSVHFHHSGGRSLGVMAMKVAAVLGVLILLLLAPPAVSQVPDDKIIVPGQRIGKWTLEMTIDDIVAMNGPARVSEIPRQTMGALPVLLYFWGNFVAATRDRKRIEYLYTLPPTTATSGPTDFKTDKEIGYQSPREAIISAFGRPTAYQALLELQGAPLPLQARLIYDVIGLAVDLTMDRATSLIVFRPGSARSQWAF